MNCSRPIEFSVDLSWAHDAEGNVCIRAECAELGVALLAHGADEAEAKAREAISEVLTRWLRAGMLQSKLMDAHPRVCEGDFADSERNLVALKDDGGSDRFLEKRRRKKSKTHWFWIGSAPSSQPKFFLRGRSVSARRTAMEEEYGPLPDGLGVVNTCGQALCVAPGHQSLVPGKVRVAHPGTAAGEFSGRAVLTPELVEEIRIRYRSNPKRVRGGQGVSMRQLAQEYGVSTSAVRKVLTEETWAPDFLVAA